MATLSELRAIAETADAIVDAARAYLAGLTAQEVEYLVLCDDVPRALALELGDAEAALAQAEQAARDAWLAEDVAYNEEYPQGMGYAKWCERQEEAASWDLELAARC